MATLVKVSDGGLRLIQQFEGFRADAYPDPKDGWKIPTIGYGTTVYANGTPVKRGDRITEEQAVVELRGFVEKKVHPTLERIPDIDKMHPNMVGALESFGYNLGPGFYGGDNFETVTRKLKNKEWGTMREAFKLYVNPGSNVEEGLRRRRSAEASLWESGLAMFQGKTTASSAAAAAPTQKTDGSFDAVKLLDFFRYYHPENPNHQAAVKKLAALLPATALNDNAEWVKTYRERPAVAAVTSGKDLKLPVRYFSQRDSRFSNQAFRMCFSSSNAMMLNYLKPGVLAGGADADDTYLERVLTFGDTTDSGAQLQALKSFGLEAEFRQNLGWADADAQLAKGIPIPIGVLHHGPVTAPSGGGHWILIVGKTADGYRVNDPYGEMDLVNGSYVNTNGENLVYSKKNLGPRWLVEGDSTGWGIMAKT